MNNSTSTSTGLSSTLKPGFKPADKALVHQWTLRQFYENSMNPSVAPSEEDEYSRYIEHPLNLPLVVSSEIPTADDPIAMEYYDYLSVTESNATPPKDFDEDGIQITLSEQARLDTDAASVRSFTSHHARPMTSQSVSTPFSHAPSYSYPQSYNHYPHVYNDVPPTPLHHQHHHHHYPLVSGSKFQTPEEDIEEFEEFLRVRENPLEVEDEDTGKKRYKAYRQWLRC